MWQHCVRDDGRRNTSSAVAAASIDFKARRHHCEEAISVRMMLVRHIYCELWNALHLHTFMYYIIGTNAYVTSLFVFGRHSAALGFEIFRKAHKIGWPPAFPLWMGGQARTWSKPESLQRWVFSEEFSYLEIPKWTTLKNIGKNQNFDMHMQYVCVARDCHEISKKKNRQ